MSLDCKAVGCWRIWCFAERWMNWWLHCCTHVFLWDTNNKLTCRKQMSLRCWKSTNCWFVWLCCPVSQDRLTDSFNCLTNCCRTGFDTECWNLFRLVVVLGSWFGPTRSVNKWCLVVSRRDDVNINYPKSHHWVSRAVTCGKCLLHSLAATRTSNWTADCLPCSE